MNKRRNWIVALVVSATAGFLALQNGIAPTNNVPITVTPTTIATETPTITPVYEGCGFMWAYHDDPELTEKVDAAVRALDPLASANATLFGEDCVFADGHSTFTVMLTDFRVRAPFDAYENEEAFGNWMKPILDAILQIPSEEIQGNPGEVEFWFLKGDIQSFIVRVPLQKYRDEAQGKSGAELFQLFHNNQ